MELRRGREAWAADERILGTSEFVLQVMQDAARISQRETPRTASPEVLAALLARFARTRGVTIAECRGPTRRRKITALRAAFSHLAIHELGASAASVARALCVAASTVHAYLLKARRDVLPHTSEEQELLKDLK
jgi:hypothetical protein